jgi:gliding motility-associated-like protein
MPMRFLFLISFLTCCNLITFSQADYSILLKTGIVTPVENKGKLSEIEASASFIQGNYYVVVQFYEIPNQEIRTLFTQKGIVCGSYLKNKAYLMSVPKSQWPLNHPQIRSVYTLKPESKIDHIINERNEDSNDNTFVEVQVHLFPGIDFKTAIMHFAEKGYVLTIDGSSLNFLGLRLNQNKLNELASIPFVQWIEAAPPENETFNFRAISNHKADILNSSLPGQRALSGKGVIVGEWDGTGVGPHIDYNDRLTNVEPFVAGAGGNHATHVCGTFGGAGNLHPRAKGMAHEVEIYAWDFAGSVTMEMDTGILKYPFVITQNSYGYNPAGDPCTVRGRYDLNSYNIDLLVNKHPHLLHVYANGNNRAANCIPGGYRTVASGYQCAKNVLTVGAIAYNNANSTFHSYGPALDGRIKPDICAVGVNVTSTFPNNNYQGGYNGTSMACPGISGTASLLYELYRRLNNNQDPHFHTLKAVMCNTATDLGRPGPDFIYGYGGVNAWRAAEILENEFYLVDSLDHGDSLIKNITLPDNLNQLKVFLCWEDKPANSSTEPALINDLDLIVITPNGDTIRPLVPDHTNVTANASQKTDTLNTNEQVTILSPESGDYKIVVLGTNVPDPKPTFTLTWESIEPQIRVTYPNGGESFPPPSTAGTVQTIRWDAWGISQPISILLSLDNGSSWDTLVQNLAVGIRTWDWQNSPDSISSNTALIRIISGTFEDNSDTTFTIFNLGIPQNFDAIPCSERLTLYWDSLNGAIAYQVYQLIDGQMKVIGQTTDTFIVVNNLVNFEEYWFAVVGIDSDGGIGPRSFAKMFVPDDTKQAPEITLQPEIQTACSGESLSFISESSIGSQPVFSQWEYSVDSGISWQLITGKESDTLNFNPVRVHHNTLVYRNSYSNECGGFEYTDTVYFQVDTMIQYLVNPAHLPVCEEDTVTLEVELQSVYPPDWIWQVYDDEGIWIDSVENTLTFSIPFVQYTQTGTLYRVTGSNFCGDTFSSDTFMLVVRPPLSLIISNDTFLCTGQETVLFAQGLGGDTLNHYFEWMPGNLVNDSLALNPLVTTLYTVSLSDGCSPLTVWDSVLVTRREPLEIFVSSDTTICIGSETTLSIEIRGGDSLDYQLTWLDGTPADLLETFVPADTGYYGFKVTDNCSEEFPEDSVYISWFAPLAVEITQIDTLCYGESVNLTATGSGGLSTAYTFSWNQGLGTGPNKTVQPESNESYMVVLTDNCTVVPDTAEMEVIVREPLSISFSGLNEICIYDTTLITVSASGGIPSQYQFIWLPGGMSGASKALNPQATTTYHVSLDDQCSNPFSDSFQIIVNPLPDLAISISDNMICEHSPVYFEHLSPENTITSRLWQIQNKQFFDKKITTSFNQSGWLDISLAVEDINGCKNDTVYSNAVEVFAIPKPNFSHLPEEADVLDKSMTFFNEGADYISMVWNFGEGSVAQYSPYHIEFPDTGNYEVTLTLTNILGCDSSITKTVRVKDLFMIHIPNAFSPDGNNINDVWKPVVRAAKDYELKLYNRWGELIFKSTDPEIGWEGNLLKSSLPASEGFYMYNISVLDIYGVRHFEKGSVLLLR